MIFGYVRVSSSDQNLDRQIKALKEYAEEHGITIDRIFEDKASGKDFNREQYQALKMCLRNEDTLIVKELDRLGRNMDQIKEEWQELQKKGVDIIVIDNELLNTSNKTDLEKTLISNIVFELLSYLAQKEREKIKSRQKEGIEIAKAKGKYKGRKPIEVDMEQFKEVYKSWKAGNITAVRAMEIMELKKVKFYKVVKEFEGRV